jgi:acyl carrier protein
MRDEVISLIAEKQKIAPETLTDQTELTKLGIDSLKAITLLYELEEHLCIEIPNEAFERIQTIGDVVAELEALQQAS